MAVNSKSNGGIESKKIVQRLEERGIILEEKEEMLYHAHNWNLAPLRLLMKVMDKDEAESCVFVTDRRVVQLRNYQKMGEVFFRDVQSMRLEDNGPLRYASIRFEIKHKGGVRTESIGVVTKSLANFFVGVIQKILKEKREAKSRVTPADLPDKCPHCAFSLKAGEKAAPPPVQSDEPVPDASEEEARAKEEKELAEHLAYLKDLSAEQIDLILVDDDSAGTATPAESNAEGEGAAPAGEETAKPVESEVVISSKGAPPKLTKAKSKSKLKKGKSKSKIKVEEAEDETPSTAAGEPHSQSRAVSWASVVSGKDEKKSTTTTSTTSSTTSSTTTSTTTSTTSTTTSTTTTSTTTTTTAVKPPTKQKLADTLILFFPDPKVCRNFINTGSCRFDKSCTFAHVKETSLLQFLRVLGSATKTLDICVYNISFDDIRDVILRAHQQRKVAVRIISDWRNAREDPGSDVFWLQERGIPVAFGDRDHHMHHKFAIIDKKILINGSFNWTPSAVMYNQENVVVSSEVERVKAYDTQFQKLWKKFYVAPAK